MEQRALRQELIFFNASLNWGSLSKSFLDIPFGSTACFTWDGLNWNCILNDIKTGAVAPVSGDVIGQGSVVLGNLPSGDNITTVTHGLAIGYAYKVLGSLRGTAATYIADNNCWWEYHEPIANSFKLSVQEASNGLQNLTFDYVLIKT